MEEKGSTESVATSKSLLNWLNTFDVLEEKVTQLEELASGQLLFKCLKSVISEATGVRDDCAPSTTDTEAWSEVWRTLEEFCGCSLDKSVSRQEVLLGNQEHIARVVVLFLCTVSYSKNNEQVVEKIKSLENSDQREIMFFIQNTIANINTNAVADGSMTSGIGDILPVLEEQASPSFLSQPSTPTCTKTPASLSATYHLSQVSSMTPIPIPKVTSSGSGSAFDSPIGMKWFTSPAISKNNPLARVQAASPFTAASSRPTPFKLNSEVSRLQRRVDLLQGMVDTNKKTAADYYSDLCAKSEHCETLLAEKNQLLAKIDQLEKFRDLQDELDQAKLNLSKAEKSVERLYAEKESLVCYKDRAKQLEDKVKDYDLALSKLQKYKEKMDSMSVALSEKTSALDQLDIAHRTIQGQLERKASEHENLSLQNDEYSREIRELLQKCQALEEDKQYLQSTLEKKTESEQLTMTQGRELDASLERAKGELETVKGERDSLEERLKTVQADFASFKAAVDHTLQDVQKENDSLKVKCNKKDRELENEVVAKKSLSSRVAQLEDERKQLSSLTLGKTNLEKEVTRLRSDLAHSIKRYEVDESALSACKAELAEKDELIMALSSEKIELLGQRDNLQANMEGMNTKYSCLAQDMDGLRKESASITEELDKLINKDGATQRQYSQLQASNRALAGQLSRAQQELKEEKASGAVKDGTIASLSANKVELEQQILQLQADYGGLLKAKEATEVEFKSQSSSKEEKTATLIEENTSLAEQLRELQTHRDDMEAKVLILEDTLAEKEKELNLLASSVKTGLEEQIKLQNQLHTRQAEMEQLKKQFSAKDVKAIALQAENASLSENWRQLKAQKEEAEKRLADKEKELKALASSVRPGVHVHVEQQIAKLQDELHTKQAEIEQHKSQCATNDEKTRALETENASLSQQLKELLVHKKDTESRLSDLEETLADKEKEIDGLAASVKTNLEEQVSELQNKLQAKQVDIEQCNSYLDSYKSQLSSMEERVASLESEKRALKERNAELESGYQAKSETDDAKVRKCHEVVAEFQTTVDQMKEKLENRSKENARLKESLIQSEETASAIREKSEAALKKLEEEKASMTEEVAQLEERLQKALEQRKELMDQCEQISNQLELNQQKYSSELQILSEQNRTLQTWQDEKYNQIRDENTENFRKMTKLYEEMDHLRAREQETTALCREYKMVAEREQGRALSATEEVKKLRGKLESYEVEKVRDVEVIEQELEQIKYQLLKEQRQAASEKSSLTAQLNYASEKIRLLEKSSQVSSPPRSRPGSRSSRQKLAPNPKMNTSASTISNFSAIVHDTHSDIELESQIQHEFDHLTTEGAQSVIPIESPEEDNELRFSGTTSKRATLASQMYRGRSGTSSRLSTLVEDRQEDDKGRISELQRRNSKALPHLKSSYAVELQTHRDSPSISNERIRNGSRRLQKTSKPPQTVSSLHLPAKRPVAFEVGLQPDPLLSSTMVTKERKRSRERDEVAQSDDNTMRSPAPKSLRRGSAPPTPQTPVDILSSIRETHRSTMAAGGLKLREYLDKPTDGDSAGQSNSGTTFMVSPPNSKAVGQGKLPKRLQENLNRRQAAQKQQSSSSSSSNNNVGVRRATIVKGKPKVSASAASRRNALKTKN